jgi:carbamoyl-phosphate synthase large subunit
MTPFPQPPFGVLVLPGGTEIGLEVRRSLADLKEVDLAGAGAPADRHGPFAYRRWATVRSVNEVGWQDELNAVIEKLGIDFVFPGHDDALLALAEHADVIDARIVTSPAPTCRLTRSKSATYEALADAVPVPEVFADAAAVDRFPVFVKPDASQGSQGAMLIHDRGALERAVAGGSDLIMEYLPGDELTVDCFSDRERGLLFARARPRLRTRAGISMSSRTSEEDPVIRGLAEAIDGRLELHGAWFFQLRQDAGGRLRLLEVAPRAAGTSAVHRVTGVNFALLSLYEQLRVPVQIAPSAIRVELDRALVNRYRHDLRYSTVYVDLDDTLIVRDAVNATLVAFLYQCLNAGHPLVLLTRHRGELDQTLGRFRLHGLWDRVVLVAEHEAKADYIPEPDAILIDDSFRERADAHERRGIATFDASMLEVLLDDRA